MARVLGSLAVLLSGVAFGQTTAPPPAFEAANVHLSAPISNPYMSGGVLRGSRYAIRNATMVDLIKTAYGVNDRQVLKGPAWLDSDRFDVIANAPPSTTPQMLMPMLQSLLADRFRLKLHHDTKPMPGYVLKLGSGAPSLKAADGSGDSGCRLPTVGPPSPNISYHCHNMTMAEFGKALPGLATRYFLGSESDPVTDLTGLNGSWDFEVKLTNNNFRIPVLGAEGLTIFDAVERLGLKLELQNVPKPVIVVDHVDRKPAGNPPGVTQILAPPPPPKVALEIKPAGPRPTGPRGGMPPPPPARALLDFRDVTLRSAILQAWGMSGPDPPLVGGPEWLDSERFDIVAKASASGPPPTSGFDGDSLSVFLRTLLEERFKLATHTEVQPVTVYALVRAPGSKTERKKAKRSNRSACRPSSEVTRRNPMLTISFACRNTTMAQLAERMRGIGLIYIDNRPVVDATGIKGSWDFNVSYTGTQGAYGSHQCPAVSNGCLTVFDALEKQLGLKLELQKRRMPVLVVDRVEHDRVER